MEQKQNSWNIRRKRKKLQTLQIHIRRRGGGQDKKQRKEKEEKNKMGERAGEKEKRLLVLGDQKQETFC